MELEPWDIFLPLLFFISMSLSIHCFTLGITSDFWTPLYIYIIGLLISKFLDSNRPIGGWVLFLHVVLDIYMGLRFY